MTGGERTVSGTFILAKHYQLSVGVRFDDNLSFPFVSRGCSRVFPSGSPVRIGPYPTGGEVPPEPTPVRDLCTVYLRFGFWWAFARLPPPPPTPDALQKLYCYDDDMVDPWGSSNAAGYMILSLLFIYIFSCNSPKWWIDSGANIHVELIHGRTGALLMGNMCIFMVLVPSLWSLLRVRRCYWSTCSMSPQ
jgi:hypothetical protein